MHNKPQPQKQKKEPPIHSQSYCAQLNEICAGYILGIYNYETLIKKGKRLGFTVQQIRAKADNPDY